MKFRFGMILGFIAGYVLGAKAGKERYEQIMRAARGFMGTETVQKVTDLGKDYLSNGMTMASERIRDAAKE
jgi:hypothetical protein